MRKSDWYREDPVWVLDIGWGKINYTVNSPAAQTGAPVVITLRYVVCSQGHFSLDKTMDWPYSRSLPYVKTRTKIQRRRERKTFQGSPTAKYADETPDWNINTSRGNIATNIGRGEGRKDENASSFVFPFSQSHSRIRGARAPEQCMGRPRPRICRRTWGGCLTHGLNSGTYSVFIM